MKKIFITLMVVMFGLILNAQEGDTTLTKYKFTETYEGYDDLNGANKFDLLEVEDRTKSVLIYSHEDYTGVLYRGHVYVTNDVDLIGEDLVLTGSDFRFVLTKNSLEVHRDYDKKYNKFRCMEVNKLNKVKYYTNSKANKKWSKINNNK